MKKLRTFGRTLINSLTNPNYGSDILAAPFGFSFKFYTAVVALVSLIVTIVASITIANFPLQEKISSVISYYPADFAFTVQDGGWEINQPLPYRLGTNLSNDPLDSTSLILFTTDEDVRNTHDFRASGALIVLTPTTLYTYEDNNTLQVESFDLAPILASGEVPDFTLSQTTVQAWVDDFLAQPFFASKLYVPLLAIIILIFVFIFIWPSILLGLLIYSFFVWLICQMFASSFGKFRYGQVYQVSLHSIWLLEILNWVVFNRWSFPYLGLVKFAIYGAWTLVLLKNYQAPAPVVAKAKTKALPAKSAAAKVAKTTKKTSRPRAKSKKTAAK